MDLLFHLSLLVVMFFLAAFFAAAETAIFSLNKIEKKRLQEAHPRISRWIMGHLQHPRQTLSTLVICTMLAHILATTLVTMIAYELFGPKGISFFLVFFTIALIFLAEIIPKTAAVGKNEAVAMASALPLQGFVYLTMPFRWLIRLASDKILSLLIPDRKESSESFSEQEIKTLVKIGEEEGVLDSHERYMLQKLLELGARPVKDIMTPRTDLVGINAEDTRQEHIRLIQQHHFSHFPVYQESLDHLLGVISVQDYMIYPEKPVGELIRQPLFVPEVKKINDLLAQFREKNENFAVCVDEYGGTAGIVTLEDILEEIFGEFYDEYAQVEHPIRAIGHHEYWVEAKLPLTDFNEFFSLHLKAQDASTLGGYLLEQWGELPEKGRAFQIPECEFVIHDVIRHRRIKTVLVRPQS